ncbi:MAG: DedA family protein [Deltaproteobacteria bacterium]|nr:DedA family protein [Deltaproteobacteria bacterium]
MLDELTRLLEAGEGPLVYLVLGLAAATEYVLPPMPGDSVSLLGIFLAATAGYSAWLVLGSLTLGSIVGSLLAWGFGRWLDGRRERWPRFMRHERVAPSIARVQASFERHGPAYLAVNRFLPGLRAFFFVAAGLSGMRPLPVAFWGGVSALVWNSLLLGLGYLVGRNFALLERIVHGYGWGALVAALIAALVYVGAKRRRPDS